MQYFQDNWKTLCQKHTYHIILLFHGTIKNPPAISRAWLHTLRNLYNVAQTIITCLSCKYEEAFAQRTATVGTRLLYCARHPLSCLGVYARWPFAGKGSENRYIRFVPTARRTVTVRLFRTKRWVCWNTVDNPSIRSPSSGNSDPFIGLCPGRENQFDQSKHMSLF